jgi:hypothetical protein
LPLTHNMGNTQLPAATIFFDFYESTFCFSC